MVGLVDMIQSRGSEGVESRGVGKYRNRQH